MVKLNEFKEQYGPRAKKWAPPTAFAGGFLFDILTLGSEVNTINLIVLSVYAGLVYLGLWLRNQNVSEKWIRAITFVLHFALGAVFSALVVLYFKSAGSVATFFMVAVLFAAQVGNEFLQHKSNQRELIWAIYTISLVMLLNFMLPHLVGSVSAILFIASCGLGLLAIWGLRHLVKAPLTAVRTATSLVAVLVVCYFAGWIPPVPLILENGLEGVNLKKVRTENGREYTIEKEPDNVFERFGLTTRDIAWKKGERVYVMTAISAPKGVEVTLQHRWYEYTEDDGWIERDVHDFTIKGGRKDGYRWYSYKSYLKHGGKWRVVTAQKNGGVLGYQTFEVVEVPEEEYPVKVREAL